MQLDHPSNRSLWRRLIVFLLLVALVSSAINICLRFWAALVKENVEQKDAAPRVLEYIAIDPGSTISDDIVSITHDSLRSLITVKLKMFTHCPFPVFWGRLSGPALAMLEWNIHGTSTTSQLEGYYRAPVAGTYSLEILVIQCSDCKFSDDFTNTCLEDPLQNRITQQGVSIRVNQAQPIPVGYWVTKKEERPLYTRFQPPNCREDPDFHSDRCTLPTSLSRFDDYEFRWQNNNSFQAKDMLLRDKNTTICFVGDSHSEILVDYMLKYAQNRSTASYRFFATFPDEVVPPKLKEGVANLNCTAMVLGIGAWPAGWPQGRPFLFEEYKSEMSKVILGMANMTNAFVLTNHYMPLGDTLTTCPPTDWRSPRVIEVYNEILRQICHEQGVPLIDTSFLISPIWDSAADWCHFRRMGGGEEAMYIASIALGLESIPGSKFIKRSSLF